MNDGTRSRILDTLTEAGCSVEHRAKSGLSALEVCQVLRRRIVILPLSSDCLTVR
jgi:hypothetical protein